MKKKLLAPIFVGILVATVFLCGADGLAFSIFKITTQLAQAAIQSINSDTDSAQTIAVGTSGNDVAVSTAAGTTTISVPSASATARGVVTTGTQTFAGAKTFSGSVSIPTTTSSTVGVINQNSLRMFHTYGTGNTFLGSEAGNFATSGSGGNNGIGLNALKDVTTGFNNTCDGAYACFKVTTADNTTGNGLGALFNQLSGTNNAAFGSRAMFNRTSGDNNVAIGANAMYNNLTGSRNIVIGSSASLDTPTITGSDELQIGQYLSGTVWHLHVGNASKAATVGSCGTSPTIVGNDNAGRVTVGTGGAATSCTVTFQSTWATTPICTVTNETDMVVTRSVPTTTTLVIDVALPFTASAKLGYHCVGYN